MWRRRAEERRGVLSGGRSVVVRVVLAGSRMEWALIPFLQPTVSSFLPTRTPHCTCDDHCRRSSKSYSRCWDQSTVPEQDVECVEQKIF